MNRKQKKVLIAGAVAGSVVLGGVVVASLERGPMVIDQDAVDSFNKVTDKQVVDYYTQVCNQIDSVSDTNGLLVQASIDSMGKDVEETKGIYSSAISDILDRVSLIQQELRRIDDSAPEHVLRPDGSEEKTNYRGALAPMLQAVGDAQKVIGGGKDAVVHAEPDKLGEEISGWTARSAEGLGAITQSLGAVVEAAPVYSEATHQSIASHPACASIIGEQLDDEEILEPVTDYMAKQTLRHETMRKVWWDVSLIGDMGAVSPSRVFTQARLAVMGVGDMASETEGDLASWQLGLDPTDPNYALVAPLRPAMHASVETMGRIKVQARGLLEELDRLDQEDVEGLQGFFESHGQELKDLQILEAGDYARAVSSVRMPNEATKKAVEKQSKEIACAQQSAPACVSGVDESVVEVYRALVVQQREVSAAIQQVQGALSQVEGMDITEAVAVIRQAASEAKGRVFAAQSGINQVVEQSGGQPVVRGLQDYSGALSGLHNALGVLEDAVTVTGGDYGGVNSRVQQAVEGVSGAVEDAGEVYAGAVSSVVPMTDETAQEMARVRAEVSTQEQ